jgi:MYXO-CTERM domain-containing protein
MIASSTRLAAATLAAILAVPAVAAAHLELTYPVPRTLELKRGPCGAVNSVRGTNVTVLAPGATIEIQWKETINHPGHYRISFDVDGQDFVVPPTATGSTEGMTNVIKDLIADRVTTPAANLYSQTITLPNVTCERCTLQVIQLMTDKAPYTTDALSDDIYYQCADIALRTPGGPDGGVDAPTGDVDAGDDATVGGGATEVIGGCGCRTSQGQGAGMALAAIVLGIVSRPRRRR